MALFDQMKQGEMAREKSEKFDLRELALALDILTVPERVYELRVLGHQKVGTASGYFSDYYEMALAASRYSGHADGVYLILNPVLPRLIHRAANRMQDYVRKGETTSDEEILERRWLMVDMDPVRPRGVSATEEEHQAAIGRAIDVREHLRAMEMRGLVLADSGNGAHVLIPYQKPNTAEYAARAQRLLQALSARFSDAIVKVDEATFNASRLCKLYGTLACKGDASPANPHRLARIMERDP